MLGPWKQPFRWPAYWFVFCICKWHTLRNNNTEIVRTAKHWGAFESASWTFLTWSCNLMQFDNAFWYYSQLYTEYRMLLLLLGSVQFVCGTYYLYDDRLCGLVVRVSGYRYRGLGFDSRRYQIFWAVVRLERGPLSLVRSIEELLELKKSSGSGPENGD